MTSPTVRARQLGRGLARLRNAVGLTQKQAAAVLDCSQTKISQMETGTTRVERAELFMLLQTYGAGEDIIERFDELRTGSRERGWWYTAGLPDWLADYVGLEQDAIRVRTVELELIPGLLQTEDYAREIHTLRGDVTARQLDERVTARIQRQARITASVNPLDLSAIVSQSALRLLTDQPDPIAIGQLRHLYDRAQLPNVHLHILPSARGRHPGMQGGFTLLSFPDDLLPDLLWQEHAIGGHLVDEERDVAKLTRLYGKIRSQALGCDESLTFLADLVENANREGAS